MIYCIEDDPSIRELELYALRSAGYEAMGFEDGEGFFAAIKTGLPELALLDIMLPGEDGVSILKKLKADSATANVPVIMATAKGSEFDKVISLDLGADDYLVKPFGMLEMVSRVKAVLRRTSPPDPGTRLNLGSIVMDVSRHIVTVNGHEISLTLKEFELLHVMIARPGMVFTRSRLLEDVWSIDFAGETRTVDVHVQTLRQKLGDASALLETVRGVGYRMTGTKQ